MKLDLYSYLFSCVSEVSSWCR